MTNIPQRNFLAFIQGLLEDAQKAYFEDHKEDGDTYVEDVFDYLSIFLSKTKGE